MTSNVALRTVPCTINLEKRADPALRLSPKATMFIAPLRASLESNVPRGARVIESGYDHLPPSSRNSGYDSIKSTLLAYSPQNCAFRYDLSPLRSPPCELAVTSMVSPPHRRLSVHLILPPRNLHMPVHQSVGSKYGLLFHRQNVQSQCQ